MGSDVNASWCFIFVQVDLFLNSLKVLKLKQQTDLRRSHKDPTKTRSTSAAEGRPAAFATCMPLTPAATPGASACLGCEPAAFAGCKRDVHHQPVHICGSLLVYDVYVTLRYPIEFAIVTIVICYFITSDPTEAFAAKTNFANELEHHPPPRKKHEVSLIVGYPHFNPAMDN